MKNYRETYIRKAEIAQLILLQQLYQQRDSRHLFFQGGTALRWCYGGSRFSEDLDFVTSLAPEGVAALLEKGMKGAQHLMIAHFGMGALELRNKSTRGGAVKCFADFRPEGAREKISVKLEFESLAPGKSPEVQKIVLSSLGSVAYLTAAGEFRVPRANAVIVAETMQEILSDKVRALLERRYLKGRDFFDLWHLYTVCKIQPNIRIIERKWTYYRADFIARRSFQFFINPSKEERALMLEAIEQDLSRFVSPEVLEVHRKQNYAGFLEAARSLFRELQDKGVCLP